MTELERLRKQNAELLEWNRYYLEVTKERRKQVEELQAEVERLQKIVDSNEQSTQYQLLEETRRLRAELDRKRREKNFDWDIGY